MISGLYSNDRRFGTDGKSIGVHRESHRFEPGNSTIVFFSTVIIHVVLYHSWVRSWIYRCIKTSQVRICAQPVTFFSKVQSHMVSSIFFSVSSFLHKSVAYYVVVGGIDKIRQHERYFN